MLEQKIRTQETKAANRCEFCHELVDEEISTELNEHGCVVSAHHPTCKAESENLAENGAEETDEKLEDLVKGAKKFSKKYKVAIVKAKLTEEDLLKTQEKEGLKFEKPFEEIISQVYQLQKAIEENYLVELDNNHGICGEGRFTDESCHSSGQLYKCEFQLFFDWRYGNRPLLSLCYESKEQKRLFRKNLIKCKIKLKYCSNQDSPLKKKYLKRLLKPAYETLVKKEKELRLKLYKLNQAAKQYEGNIEKMDEAIRQITGLALKGR